MVEKLTKAWTQEGRICGLEECCRHVYAKEDGKCHDYCGMEHATLAAARRGATMVTEAAATALLNPKPMEKKRSADKVDTDHNVDDNVYIENDRQRDPKVWLYSWADWSIWQRVEYFTDFISVYVSPRIAVLCVDGIGANSQIEVPMRPCARL